MRLARGARSVPLVTLVLLASDPYRFDEQSGPA